MSDDSTRIRPRVKSLCPQTPLPLRPLLSRVLRLTASGFKERTTIQAKMTPEYPHETASLCFYWFCCLVAPARVFPCRANRRCLCVSPKRCRSQKDVRGRRVTSFPAASFQQGIRRRHKERGGGGSGGWRGVSDSRHEMGEKRNNMA